ncbi:MAG: hypothetical protein MI919_25890, partial [Holophagales bacterium]|nr:hypothetical protein [Holophagales bacterium]
EMISALIKRDSSSGNGRSRQSDPSPRLLDSSEASGIESPPGVLRDERRLDAVFLKRSIDSAFDRLEALIGAQVKEFRSELRKERTRQLVVALQAKVAALKNLIVLQDSESGLTAEVVKASIFPLRSAVEEVAADVGDGSPHLVDYCLIIGNSALVAAHGYLGHDAHQIRSELETAVRRVQVDLLDQIALQRLQLGMRFPWDRVSYLLEVENACELQRLYIDSLEESKAGGLVVMRQPAKEVRQLISTMVDVGQLQALERVERAGRSRATVLEALSARIRKLTKRCGETG